MMSKPVRMTKYLIWHETNNWYYKIEFDSDQTPLSWNGLPEINFTRLYLY